MFKGFPSSAYRKFSSKLSDASGETGFDRLKDYYSSVVGAKKKGGPWDAGERIDSGKFFYYPCESSGDREKFNCFENSAHFLMATQELYPQSSPRLIYVDEGKRGTHSLVAFNHQGKFYGGDFNYEFLGPIHFDGKRIIHDEKKKLKFKSLTILSDSEVLEVINRLRGKNGCEHFLSEGGQQMKASPNSFRPYEIFMKYNSGKLISELRFHDFDLTHNVATRRIYDLEKNTFDLKFFIYSFGNWSELKGSKEIAWAREPVPIREKVLVDGFLTKTESEERGLDTFVKIWTAYHYGLRKLSTKKSISLRDYLFYRKESLKDFLDNGLKDEKYKMYLKSLKSERFRCHVLDYLVFKNDLKIIQGMSKKKNAKTWKDVSGPKSLMGQYTQSFVEVSHIITKKEFKVHRSLDHKVIDLLQGQ